MQGLDLCQQYFQQMVLPLLKEGFADYLQGLAVGMVGEGSDCFGKDDLISRDHDWGPGLCFWLQPQNYAQTSLLLKTLLEVLPPTFQGFPVRSRLTERGQQRTGIFQISGFYQQFLGQPGLPETPEQWWVIPQINLAAVTNGRVFWDPAGVFTAYRQKLLAYYPEEIRRKKLAACCLVMAQAGQYNYPRSLQRQAYGAAYLAMGEFMEAALHCVYGLNRSYAPFYKWLHPLAGALPLLGAAIYDLVLDLTALSDRQPDQAQQKIQSIEEFCGLIQEALRDQGLTTCQDRFLLPHAQALQSSIKDPWLRQLPLLVS